MFKQSIIAIATLLVGCTTLSQSGPVGTSDDITVMVLATYHLGNPGQDLNNIDAEDVLTPHRQAELAMLADVLAEFEPTVVAVERTAPPPYDDPVWQDYGPTMLAERRDERVQIGYRLAERAGVDRVYAVDEQPSDGEPSYFPYDTLQAFAKDTGREAELEALSDWSGFMKDFERRQTELTIPALLQIMNGPEFHDEFYWNVIAMGDGERQPGPELAAYWFMRNAKIINKLTQVTQAGDRVVLVYGAGHGHWLRQIVDEMPGYRLEPVQPYLERADRLSRD